MSPIQRRACKLSVPVMILKVVFEATHLEGASSRGSQLKTGILLGVFAYVSHQLCAVAIDIERPLLLFV